MPPEDGARVHLTTPSARDELCIRGAVFFAARELGHPLAPVAFASDASLQGFALSAARLAGREGQAEALWRERWRFAVASPTPRSGRPLPGRLVDCRCIAARFGE